MSLELLVLLIVVLIVLRVPIAVAMLAPCLIYVFFEDGLTMGIVLQRMTALLNSFPLVAVPLFILLGYLVSSVHLADRLVDFIHEIFGRVRGGLAYVNVMDSVVFGMMSGSSMADAAALGAVVIPRMIRHGYEPGFAVGLTAASAVIGPIMPPSISAIIYGVVAGVSIGAMFAAGVIPALVIAAVLLVHVYLHVRTRPGLSETRSRSFRRLVKAGLDAAPVLLIPPMLLLGILGGVFTPTEAAAVAVLYVIVLSMLYRAITWQSLWRTVGRSAYTTGQVMLIASAGGMLAYVLSREQAASRLSDMLLSFTDSPLVFLLVLNLVLLFIGTLLEPTAALLITVPVAVPVAAEFGIDPVQLGVVMILNLVIGMLTPPVALVLNVLSAVSDVSLRDGLRGTWPFLVPLLVALALVTYWAPFTLWLPELLGF